MASSEYVDDQTVSEIKLGEVANKIHAHGIQKFALLALEIEDVEFSHLVAECNTAWDKGYKILVSWKNKRIRSMDDLYELIKKAEKLGCLPANTAEDIIKGGIRPKMDESVGVLPAGVKLTEQELGRLARNYLTSRDLVARLGEELSLKQSEMDGFLADHPHNIPAAAKTMLIFWMSRNKKNRHIREDLINALDNSDLGDAYIDIFKTS